MVNCPLSLYALNHFLMAARMSALVGQIKGSGLGILGAELEIHGPGILIFTIFNDSIINANCYKNP
jgi:hypothetical protein